MIDNWVLLIVGVALLVKGADLFVGGSSKIAKALKVPSLIIGLTLVSIGTSAPEASVSINAAINNMNEMSISNVVGSNAFNTLVILGMSSIFVPLVIDEDMKKYDIPIMMGVYCMLILFSFITTPYKLNLIEAIILLIIFTFYMIFLIARGKKNMNGEKEENDNCKTTKIDIIKGIAFSVLGLSMIIYGGNIVVNNASKIAMFLGMSQSLVGLTIVAVGTSLPELVTSIVASIKKENDIAIGNAVGSNIMNIVFILGMTSAISPVCLSDAALFDVSVLLITGLIILMISLFSKKINRWHGVVLLSLYITYLIYIIIRN